MKRKFKGFTLVEMMITVTLVIVLSSISIPIYKDHVFNAKRAEGYALLATIRDAQMQYYNEYERFLDDDHSSAGNGGGSWYTCNETVLGINARTNKYYTWFTLGHATNFIFYAAVFSKDDVLYLDFNITSGATYRG